MNTLKVRLRNRKNEVVGVAIAVGRNQVGWSLCNKSDKYNQEKAEMIALRRACEGSNRAIPHSINAQVVKMAERSQRYFKNLV